jgi:CubicO group peptidase (beta-lactamase class C family)
MKFFSLSYLFILLPLMACAQQEWTLSEEAAKNIEMRIDNGYSPSIAIGLIDEHGPRCFFFGKTTMGGKDIDENTIYEIGSISKTFTGILLADMVKSGKMKLDDPVQQYLPETVKMPEWEGQPISLGQLSDHTSGLTRLPDNMSPADMSNPYADYSVEQMYEFLSSHQLRREMGTEYEYSNLAQGLLGHVLALTAGKSYEALMIEKIAAPLGMTDTRIDLNEAQKAQMAPGHSLGGVVSNWDIPTLAGAGAIRSTLHDMLIYLSANMGMTESPVYPAMQLSHKVRHDKAGGMRVGLGWHIKAGAEGDVVWHNGGTGGYRTFAGFLPDKQRGVVVLTNSDKGADDIGFHLLDSGTDLAEPIVSIAMKLKEAIDEDGPTTAMGVYEEMIKADPATYNLNEQEINNVGYHYLQNGDTESALRIFEVNKTAFPQSFNVYDSYAEALMESGNKEEAIANYQKSLELNPGNTNAVEKLTELGAAPETAAIEIDEATLESYTGTYVLQPGFDIVVTREGSQLFGQATGQGKFELFPKSDHEFFLKVVEAQVTFNVKDDGTVEQLILHQGGMDMPAKKK